MNLGVFEIIFRANGAEQLKKAMSDIRGEAKRTGDSLSDSAKKVGEFGGVISKLAIGGALVSFGKAAFDAAVEMEELNARLISITHSGDKASKIMKVVREVAKPSPFTTKQLAEAATQLEAFGVNAQKALPKLAKLGAAFGADEEHLRSLVNIFGKLNQGIMPDTEQLSMFGLNKSMLAAEGMKFDKNGALLSSASEAMDALGRLIEKKYGGIFKMMGGTTKAGLATVEDAYRQLLESFGQMELAAFKTLAPPIIEMMGKFTEFLNALKTDGSVAQNVMKALAGSLAFAGSMTVINGLKALIPIFQGISKALKAVAAGEALVSALGGWAGIGKVAAGLVVAAGAMYAMDQMFNSMEKGNGMSGDAADLQKAISGGGGAGSAASSATEGTGRKDGSIAWIEGMARIFSTAGMIAGESAKFRTGMEDYLAQIAKNTGTTADLLDLRKQTFGGGALGSMGVTAAELREGGGGPVAAGVGVIPNELVPYSTDLERSIKRVFANEYRKQFGNLMRRL
jgi:hypothetical protein